MILSIKKNVENLLIIVMADNLTRKVYENKYITHLNKLKHGLK